MKRLLYHYCWHKNLTNKTHRKWHSSQWHAFSQISIRGATNTVHVKILPFLHWPKLLLHC